MSAPTRTAGTSKDLRMAFKVCVMLTLYAVTFQVKSLELAGILLLTPIIQIALFQRPPKPPPSHIEEKIKFFYSQPKSKVGEIVAGIIKTDTTLSSTFS